MSWSRRLLILALLSTVALPAYADMYPDASNAKQPAARNNFGLRTLSVTDYGAKLDGVTNDGPALNAAIAQANTLWSGAHIKTCVYVPSGILYVNSPTPAFIPTNPGCLVGDGGHRSYIKLGPAFSGDLFNVSEAIEVGWSPPPTVTPETDQSGPLFQGFAVFGNETTANIQNVFMFYDRNDQIRLNDIVVTRVHGRAISVGLPLNQPNAYAREGFWQNLNIYYAGLPGVPAVEIMATGTGDTSNNHVFAGVNILHSACQGFAIRNKVTPAKDISHLRFYGLRIENSDCDQLQIGDSDPAYLGGNSDLQFYGLIVNATAANYSSIGLYAATGAQQPYGILIKGGSVNAQAGHGLNIQSARSSEFDITLSSIAGKSLIVGSTALVGLGIYINGYGSEFNWATDIDPSSASRITVVPQATYTAEGPGDLTLAGQLFASGGLYSGSNTFTGNALRADGPATSARSLRWLTENSTRWTMGLNNVAEAGANVGADFVLVAYGDDGIATSSPLRIRRNNGLTEFLKSARVSGHLLTDTTLAPVLSACGTSPTIVGSDIAGTITMGTGAPAGCVLTFNAAYALSPICTVSWRAPPAAHSYTVNTTTLTLTQTATSSNQVDYVCTARSNG